MTPQKKIVYSIILLICVAVYFKVAEKESSNDQLLDSTQSDVSQEIGESSVPIQVKGSQVVYTKKASYDHLEFNVQNIIWYTNYYRSLDNLPPLKSSKKLTASATAKNNNMVDDSYFDHKDPKTGRVFDWFITAEHYDYIKTGENLASGDFRTSYEVVNAWMKSPSHRKNLLDPSYTEIGIAIQPTKRKGQDIVLVTQHFGKPRTSCPTIDQSIKTSITNLELTIKNLKHDTLNMPPDTDTYKTLVSTYNKSVSRMGDLVSTYNKQIQAFDSCVKGK